MSHILRRALLRDLAQRDAWSCAMSGYVPRPFYIRATSPGRVLRKLESITYVTLPTTSHFRIAVFAVY